MHTPGEFRDTGPVSASPRIQCNHNCEPQLHAATAQGRGPSASGASAAAAPKLCPFPHPTPPAGKRVSSLTVPLFTSLTFIRSHCAWRSGEVRWP